MNPWIRKEAILRVSGPESADLGHVLCAHYHGETDQSVRACIATSLGSTRDLQFVGTLREMLRDPNPRVVANEIEALERIRDPSTYEAIFEHALDASHRVRANVVVALWGKPQCP